MSKLNSQKINFNEKDFVVKVSEENIRQNQISEEELVLNRAQNEAELEIKNAQKKAEQIIESAQAEAQSKSEEIIEKAKLEAQTIIDEAQGRVSDIVEEANTNKNELLTNAQTEIEQSKQEGAKKGYEEGYNDAKIKFFEENEEKINAFDEFCSKQNIIRNKILKNASREIINIIQNISHVVLLKEVDGEVISKIIQKTLSLFDKKENITIILSKKYAQLLYELQKKEIDAELNFEDFNQYKNFNVIYNNDLPDDTIIIENPEERFCASIESQLDKIMREILNNTQNGNLNVEEYDETATAE